MQKKITIRWRQWSRGDRTLEKLIANQNEVRGRAARIEMRISIGISSRAMVYEYCKGTYGEVFPIS